MKKEELMKLAIDLATLNVEKEKGGPFGAVIVKGDEIVGFGTNMVTELKDPTAHAEIIAIRNACNNLQTHDLSECILYSSCEPCPMCMASIYWANIKEVYYGAMAEEAEYNRFRDTEILSELKRVNSDKSIKIEQVEGLEEISSIPFELWSKTENKIEY